MLLASPRHVPIDSTCNHASRVSLHLNAILASKRSREEYAYLVWPSFLLFVCSLQTSFALVLLSDVP
ncbi:unnamed protein product [Victoria cruziana]